MMYDLIAHLLLAQLMRAMMGFGLYNAQETASNMRVYLSVSSLASTSTSDDVIQRQLELNWYNEMAVEGDLVGLYDSDPLVNSTGVPLEQVEAVTYPDNYYQTSITFVRPDMDTMEVTRQCLGYWVAFVRQGSVLASDCLRLEPNWMWEHKDVLAPLRLRDVMIPGTHDAGSYMYYDGASSDNIVQRWTAAQEENIREQLMYGIRDFDLRIAYYEDTPEIFWLNHGGVRVNPFQQFIDACVKFINETNEILVFDFHEFPVGFDGHPERHQQFIDLLTQQFGAYMLSPSVGYDVTLDTIWSSNKRIVAAYNDPARSDSDLLWDGVPQIWADTTDGQYLFSYMDGYMNSGRTDIWSAQLEFTESTSDVLLTYSSLRVLANEINRNVTEWCRDLWWNKANIVALDYFLGSNIIQVAIESNSKRLPSTS